MRKKSKSRIIVKIVLCMIYLFIIGILFLSSFELYQKDREIIKWSDVEKSDQYSYLKISQMSEAFATIDHGKKQIHFVIEEDNDGSWHTYLVAIDQQDYDKYKEIIDYTYERIEKRPTEITLYGYPKEITNQIKTLAIKNIANFVPIENQIMLTDENFYRYLTSTYLDTTMDRVQNTNYTIVLLMSLILIILVLLVLTIFDRDKIVNEVGLILEKDRNSKRLDHHDIQSKKNQKMKNRNVARKKKKKKNDDIEQL